MTEQELDYAVKVNDRDLRDLIKRIDAVNLALGPETKQATETASQAIATHAQTVVSKTRLQREELHALLENYKAIGRQAKRGSEEQIAANVAAAKTARRLGIDIKEAGLQYDHLGRNVHKLERDASQATRGILAGSGALRGLGRSAAYAGGFFIGTASLTQAIRSSWDELQQLNRESGLADAALKSTGGVAGETRKQIVAFADAEARKVPIDKALIEAAEVQLLRFTEVRNELGKGNDIYTQASKAALDLAQRTGGDATAAALQLGKALNDPVRGLTALRRVGVTFTQSQQDQIKALAQSGNILKAQKLILKQVELAYGGAADAAGKKLGGQMTILKNEAKDLGATFLTDLQPEIKGVVTDLRQWIDHMTSTAKGQQELKHDAHELANGLKDLVGFIRAVYHGAKDAADAVGGWKHMFELIIALKVAGWIGGVASSLKTLIGAEGAAGLLGAESAAGGLLGKLKALKTLGPIAIVLSFVPGNSKGQETLNNHGIGWAGKLPIIGGYEQQVAALYASLFGTGAPTDPTKNADLSGLPWNVKVAPGANRAGAPLHQSVVDFVAAIANLAQEQLTITTGTNHNKFVAGTHRQSDHWTGDASDIFTGNGYGPGHLNPELIKLGRDALIAAGADPAWANKQTGGLFNVGNKQIIFDSMQGGNHYNHLHVGVRADTNGSSNRYTPHDGGGGGGVDMKSVRLRVAELRQAVAAAEGTRSKSDDQAAIGAIVTYLKSVLAKLPKSDVKDRTTLLGELATYVGRYNKLGVGKAGGLASDSSTKSFKDALKAELADVAAIAAAGFGSVAAKAKPKLLEIQKLLAKPLTSKQLADLKVQLREIEKAYDLKGLKSVAASVTANKASGAELVGALQRLPADLVIPVKDAWGEVVKTISPADLIAEVNAALAALGAAKNSSQAKKAIAELKKLGQDATEAISVSKDGVVAAAQAAVDAANTVLSDAKSKFQSSWSSMAGKALSAFDQETQNALAKMSVLVNGPAGQFLYTSGAMTPGQSAAAQLTSQHDAALQAKQYAIDKQDLADKQKRVDQLVAGGFSEQSNALRSARQDLSDAQAKWDDDTYQQQLAAYNAQGDLEQSAADKQLEIAQRNYQSERDLQKEHLQNMLDDLERSLEEGKISVADARTKLGVLWDAIGLDSGLAGTAMGDAFVTSLNESLNDPANGIWSTLDAVSQAIADLKNLKTLKTNARNRPPVDGPGGSSPGTRLVPMAGGAWVTRRPGGVPALVGEGGHDEVVAPEPKLRRLLREELARSGSPGSSATLSIGEYHVHTATDEQLLVGRLSLLLQQRPRA